MSLGPTVPPLVSVIIPCWNCERFVADAIHSALNQSYPNIEVIAIDDGSADGTLEVLKTFSGRIHWETGPNRGANFARNAGLRASRGAYIQFLDADDLLHPTKIAEQVDLARCDPATIIYCARETCYFESPTRKWIDSPTNDGDDVIFALMKIISTAAPLYTREQLDAVGGWRADLSCGQDYDLNLRLAVCGYRFRKLDKILVTVRRRATSVSSDALKVLRELSKLWRSLFKTLEDRGDLVDSRRIAIAKSFAGAARTFHRHGNIDEARAFFAEALRIDARGARAAYGLLAWLTNQVVGASATETLVKWKRRLTNRSGRPL